MSKITPEEWFICRLDDPAQLFVRENQYGNWDILLRIDGGYRFEDAVRVRESHRTEIEDLYRRIRTGSQLRWMRSTA